MASAYALPASAMTKSHGHSHSHNQDHGQTRSTSPHRLSGPSNGYGPSRSFGPSTGSFSENRMPANVPPALEKPGFEAPNKLLTRSQNGATLPSPSWEKRSHRRSTSNMSFNSINSFGSIPEGSVHDHAHTHAHTHPHDHAHDHFHFHFHDHDEQQHDGDRGKGHCHEHTHGHIQVEPRSRFTSFLLRYAEAWPLLNSILLAKDSRRIFYFMSLNFAFMMIQAFYGLITDSLGLLSDSIHMFFDCLALAMGLFAAVASRWPASLRFPYGLTKIETLSGFGNGVFLMLISVEIIIEALDRLADGRETKRLNELFVVSTLGLLVNLVGMASFGHHHHGHSHNHDHSDAHSHAHNHDHDTHDGPGLHMATSDNSPLSATAITAGNHAHSHAHSHSHNNENMHGIFLHVLADTMGSAAVIVSTILIKMTGWPGWDPIASVVIAVLIFLSAIPLVKSSASALLLTIPADTEYQLRNTLAEVSGLRGVASYSVPRFWMGSEAGHEKGEKVLGVIHVIATRSADVEDVRRRTRALLSDHGMDVVVQVDREGEGRCWCGGDASSRTPTRF